MNVNKGNKTAHRFIKLNSIEKIRRANTHANRFGNTPNADPNKKALNKLVYGTNNMVKRVKSIINKSGVKTRKNSVLVVEGVISLSREYFETKDDIQAFYMAGKEYIMDNFKDNLVSVHFHLDETTPHFHFFIVPLTKDGRLSARDLFNYKELEQHQKRYCDYISQRLRQTFTYEKGSKAKHKDIKKFYTHINKTKAEMKSLELNNKKLTNTLIEEEENSFKLESEVNTLKNELNEAKEEIKSLKELINKLRLKFSNSTKAKNKPQKLDAPSLNMYDFPDPEEALDQALKNENKRLNRLKR